jgi:hypothetical protein
MDFPFPNSKVNDYDLVVLQDISGSRPPETTGFFETTFFPPPWGKSLACRSNAAELKIYPPVFLLLGV